MPPTLEDRLNDILTAIEEIDSLLAGMRKEQFVKDRYRRLATERLLEIVSEASRRLPQSLKDAVDAPWRDIADLGNLLRHAYFLVDPDTIWYIAQNDLPALKNIVVELIAKSGDLT